MKDTKLKSTNPVKSIAKGRLHPETDALLRLMPQRLAALRGSRAAQDRARVRREAFGERRAPLDQAERVEIGGLTWAIPPHSEDGYADRMLAGWLPVAEIVQSLPWATGRVMLDIGAHIGTTSIPRVVLNHFEAAYCAEPEPQNYAALVENITANGLEGFVLADNIAISDQDGEAAFVVSHRTAGHRLGRRGSITVPLRSIDSWVASLGLDPADISFVKTDTQGYDGFALKGAPELLQHRHIVWQIELWPSGMQKAGMSLPELFALISDSFTHFADVRHVKGERSEVQPVTMLADALAYLEHITEDGERTRFTNLLLLNLAEH